MWTPYHNGETLKIFQITVYSKMKILLLLFFNIMLEALAITIMKIKFYIHWKGETTPPFICDPQFQDNQGAQLTTAMKQAEWLDIRSICKNQWLSHKPVVSN